MARPMSQSVVPKLSIAHVSLPYPDALTMTPYAGRMSCRWISRVAVRGWGLRLLPMYLYNKTFRNRALEHGNRET